MNRFKLPFLIILLLLCIGGVFLMNPATVLANHEPNHNVDLIIVAARYIPNEGRFELTVRNIGPDPVEDNVFLSLAWYSNGELVIPVFDTLFLEEIPFLGPNETRQIIYDSFNPDPGRLQQIDLLFNPYGLLADNGIDPTSLQQPELRLMVDPFNMIPEMDETNNNNPFIQLLPELELGAMLGVDTPDNLQLTFANTGLSPINANEGIAITFEWLDADQILIENESMNNFYGIDLDFEGSGNFFSTTFNSTDDPFVQQFITQPPADAVFLSITANPMVLGEWLTRDNNVRVLGIPEEFLVDNDANLALLALEPVLNFNFDPDLFFQLYEEVEAPYTQESIRVTAVLNDPNAMVTINEFFPDETGGVTLGLGQGRNEIGVLVRAANGISTRFYAIVVTRATPPVGGSSWPSSRRFQEETPPPVVETPVTPTVPVTPLVTPPETTPPVVETPVTPTVPTTPTVTPPEEILGVKISRVDELINTVKPGASRREIRELQKALKELGYYPRSLETHGHYGAATVRGVLKYQRGKK